MFESKDHMVFSTEPEAFRGVGKKAHLKLYFFSFVKTHFHSPFHSLVKKINLNQEKFWTDALNEYYVHFFFSWWILDWCNTLAGNLALVIKKSELTSISLFWRDLYFTECYVHKAISRKVVVQNVHATIPKGNMGYDQYTVFPETFAVKPTFVVFL